MRGISWLGYPIRLDEVSLAGQNCDTSLFRSIEMIDPELRTIGSGSTVVNFTIAASTRQYNRNTNQWEDGDTLFMNCSAWDGRTSSLASNIANSLSKGMRVIAQGRLTQRSYQAQDGTQRTVVELRVDEIGPSLTRATAQVTRQASQGGFQGRSNGGFQGGQQPGQGYGNQGGYQGGYQGGAGYSQQSAPSNPAAQSAPATDRSCICLDCRSGTA